MSIQSATLSTPIGPFTVTAGTEGVIAAGFVESPHNDGDPLPGITSAIIDYFDGDLDALARVPVAQQGSPYLRRVIEELRQIPAGGTLSYRELAARTGAPLAARAAGSACARNAVALIVPCHRVVSTTRGLGGYRWGLERKRWLLEHERSRGRLPLGG